MDHHEIEQRDVVGRYVMGRLSLAEQARFEEHFLDCEQCLDQIDLTRDFRESLQRAAAEDAARSVASGTLLAWLARRRSLVAGAALLVALLPAILLGTQNRGLRQRLDRITRPHVAVPAALLSLSRDREEAPTEVAPAAAAAWLTLEVQVGEEAASYQTALHDAGGRLLWRVDGVRPSRYDTLILNLPTGFLAAGVYRLKVEGVDLEGRRVEVGSYRFRVVDE